MLTGGNLYTHMLHAWYIYLHDWVIFSANVGKYSIHGAYGTYIYIYVHTVMILFFCAFMDHQQDINISHLNIGVY